MLIREYFNGTMRKPYIVNYSIMNPVCCITAKVKTFRTADQANEFLRKVVREPGFIRINSAYCRDFGYIR